MPGDWCLTVETDNLDFILIPNGYIELTYEAKNEGRLSFIKSKCHVIVTYYSVQFIEFLQAILISYHLRAKMTHYASHWRSWQFTK